MEGKKYKINFVHSASEVVFKKNKKTVRKTNKEQHAKFVHKNKQNEHIVQFYGAFSHH